MLTAHNLRKQFTTVLAVDDVSLEVQRGRIFGLIGPNGAGKSTTIRMLLNITVPDSGTIAYDGAPFNDAVRNKIGYLPEERGLYKKNGLMDSIVYFATLRGMDSTMAKKKGMEWLERFDLQAYAKGKIEELSKGNQQKAQFITTILHDPELIILDEPFSGLDPVNQIVMKNVLQELKQKGKAVIFSTHQMDSAEKLCDEICLINKGKIVLEGTLKDVKQKFGTNSLHLEYDGDGKFLASLPFVKKSTVYENYAELVLKNDTSSREIMDAVTPKLDLRKFEFMEPSLNSIFLNVVGVPEDLPEKKDAPAVTHPRSSSALISSHPKVKKAFFTMIVIIILTIIMSIINIKKPHPEWNVPAFLSAVSLFSIFRFIKERKSAKKEITQKMEGGHHE
jgi:ABC-2 type transport system ATP-binding protein